MGDEQVINSGDPNGGAGSNGGQAIALEIDGEMKQFSADDVLNLVNQQASATQKTQQVSAVLKACDKFDMDPESFVGQAEGAFNVLAGLIEAGIVDEQGNLVNNKSKSNDIDFKQKPAPQNNVNINDDKVSSVVSKALEPLMKKIEDLEKDQLHLTRLRINDSVKSKFNNLDDKDMSEVFAVAKADRSKTLMQHAESISKKKEGSLLETKKALAKELGIDYDEFIANKLREQTAEGGAAGMFTDKKISFKKSDKNSLSPRAAMMEYFKNLK